MNRRFVTILFVALVIAGTCAFLVYRIASSRIGFSKRVQMVTVVAAKENTKIGTVLSPSSLTTIEIAGTPPKGAILRPENAIGRGVISNLYQGEAILEDRLAAAGSGGGLAAIIPDGMRACAVKVDEVVGVAGFATPGMRVDVLTSGTPTGRSNGNENIIVNTILQNIEVLSAGTDIQKDEEGKPKQVKVVNLLVTPEQAETLSLASNHLNIQLVLRNPLDTKLTNVPHTTLASVLGAAIAPATPSRLAVKTVRKVDPPKAFLVEVINGAKRSEVKFAVPEEQQ